LSSLSVTRRGIIETSKQGTKGRSKDCSMQAYRRLAGMEWRRAYLPPSRGKP